MERVPLIIPRQPPAWILITGYFEGEKGPTDGWTTLRLSGCVFFVPACGRHGIFSSAVPHIAGVVPVLSLRAVCLICEG